MASKRGLSPRGFAFQQYLSGVQSPYSGISQQMQNNNWQPMPGGGGQVNLGAIANMNNRVGIISPEQQAASQAQIAAANPQDPNAGKKFVFGKGWVPIASAGRIQ